MAKKRRQATVCQACRDNVEDEFDLERLIAGPPVGKLVLLKAALKAFVLSVVPQSHDFRRAFPAARLETFDGAVALMMFCRIRVRCAHLGNSIDNEAVEKILVGLGRVLRHRGFHAYPVSTQARRFDEHSIRNCMVLTWSRSEDTVEACPCCLRNWAKAHTLDRCRHQATSYRFDVESSLFRSVGCQPDKHGGLL